MVHQVLQRFRLQLSSPQPTPLSTGHSLSSPPSNESVEPSGPYPELVGCLMYLMTCTRPDLIYPLSVLARYVAPGRYRKVHWDAAKRVLRYLCSSSGMGLVLGGRGPVVLTGHADASWVDDSATQQSPQGYTFSLGSGSVSWRSTCSSSVLSSSCEAEIYAGAMVAQELRWLTYLLSDLREQPRFSPVLYVDNKAMIALCQEHRLEHRTKHIFLRYFLARELQQRGQLRLAYVATRANTADVFTKALSPATQPLILTVPAATTAATATAPTTAATAAAACCTAMASLRVLTFDHEGRPVQFDTWLDDLQQYLLSDSKDIVSLFDLASGANTAPPATADSATRSQWLTRDAAARLPIRNHLTLAKCAHFGQHRTAQALYDAVVARYYSMDSTRNDLYVIRTGVHAGQTCGKLHTQHRCFSRLDIAWRAEFGDDVELPRWADLLMSRIVIFDLDFDAFLSTMYALSVSAEGDCYRCVPPDPGIAAAALGASAFGTLAGTAPTQALHTFTLYSGATACFFRNSSTLTPLSTPDLVRVADPSGGPVVARSSTVLLCPASPQVAASAQVSASGQVAASRSCCLLSHQTLLWHHRLGHPSLPCLRGMHSRLHVSGLPTSLSPLPPSPAPPCLLCVKGRQRAAPHSSSFPLTTAPLQTLQMDVWGPARVSGQSREHYFMLVVDYTRYTIVFHLRSKGQVVDVLIPWIRTFRLQLCERFGQDLPVLHLHFDRGGEFSSDLLRDFCRGEGVPQSSTLRDSPQQNGIAKRRIGLVIEVARTSMIHAPASHFMWSFAVRSWDLVPLFAIRPRTSSQPVLSPMSSLALSLTRLACNFTTPPRAVSSLLRTSCLTSRFPYRSAPPPPPPLFHAPGPPPVDPLPPQGPAPSGVSQVDPLPGPVPVQVAISSGAAQGAASGGAAFGGAEPGGAECEGAETGGAEAEDAGTGGAACGGVESVGGEPRSAESGGAKPQGAASSGGSAGASPRMSPQQLREWFVQHARLRSGATVARGAGAAEAGGAGVAAGAGVTGGIAATGPGGARTLEAGGSGAGGAGAGGAGVGGTGTGGARVGGPGVGGAGAGGAGAVDPGDAVRPRPYFVPLLQEVLGTPSSTSLTPPLLCPPPDQSQPPLQPASPLLAPSPYTEQYGGLTEHRLPASLIVSLVRTARHVPRSRPPPVPITHDMTLLPSSVPLRVPLPAPPESSLPEVPDSESDRARAASPTISRLLATTVTDPSFECAVTSALVAELLDFAAPYRLDYINAFVAQSASTSPPSVGGECALGTDNLENRQEDFECLAATVPRFAFMLLAPEGDSDAPDIPTPRSYEEAITGTYVDEFPPPGANIVDGMWIFRVKRPPGSPPAFKARYVARGFSQRRGVDYFQTFSPTPKRTTLQVLLHVAAQRDYELHSLDFSTAFLQGCLHEIWLRRPPGFTESLSQWHDTLRTTLAALGFAPSTADPSLFLCTDTSLPPFYVLVCIDDLVFATADTEALTLVKSELQKRHTCTNLGELRCNIGL
ncbi:unnamed protein product [Closterium sp. NIES-54]